MLSARAVPLRIGGRPPTGPRYFSDVLPSHLGLRLIEVAADGLATGPSGPGLAVIGGVGNTLHFNVRVPVLVVCRADFAHGHVPTRPLDNHSGLDVFCNEFHFAVVLCVAHGVNIRLSFAYTSTSAKIFCV